MTSPILDIRGLVKSFGGLMATDHVDLCVEQGEIHALIGPNGAGKTTLLSQIAGELRRDRGEIRFLGNRIDRLPAFRRAGAGLARTFQITNLLREETVLDNVTLAIQIREGHSFRFLANGRRNGRRRAEALEHLRLAGLGDRADGLAANLSHGEQKQLELAVALACRPRLLLLDEPMAGLGPAESQEMIQLLRGLKGTVPMLLVEHDMDAVFTLADRISVLVYGKIIASGTLETIRSDPAVRSAYLGERDVAC